MAEAYSGTNNTLNGTISSTSKWCGACHYSGNANFTNMQTRFTADGWEKPPDGANEAWNTDFFNHSSVFSRNDSDLMCKYCHNSLLSATAKMDEFVHNVAQGEAGPDCVSCHDIGRTDATDVDVSVMNSSTAVHRLLNNRSTDPGNTSDPDQQYNWNNRRCWACHSNGSMPSNVSMGNNFLNPYLCYDCHTNKTGGLNATGQGNYSAPGIYEHFNNTDTSMTPDITPNAQCWQCHNNSVLDTNDPEFGFLLTNYDRSNVSHYGTNTSLNPGGSNTTNCVTCHKNETIAKKWYLTINIMGELHGQTFSHWKYFKYMCQLP